ncbi:MAG: NAD(P)/FAD-dependent oxidoreductase [Neptuniibacter sp.]
MENVKPHVAIVGAGLAGSVLADLLVKNNCLVTVFDKSRGTGGRLSTCRLGDYSADLGAPYILDGSGSATEVDFSNWLLTQPQIEQWSPRVSDFKGNAIENLCFTTASPRQSALTRSLIAGAEFIPSTRVGYIWPELVEEKAGVIVRDDKGKGLGQFDAVVVATPALQAVPLLEAIPRFMKKAEAIKPEVSWVHVMVTYSESRETPDLILGEHEILSRITKDSAKPGRICPENSDVWVIEASPDWSRDNENSNPEDVAEHLRKAFMQLFPSHNHVIAERTHRWLYARHSKTDTDFLWDSFSRIGVCGDWFGQGETKAAWQSATLLSKALIEHFEQMDMPSDNHLIAV